MFFAVKFWKLLLIEADVQHGHLPCHIWDRNMPSFFFFTQKCEQYKRSATHVKKIHFYCFMCSVTTHMTKKESTNQLLITVYSPKNSQPGLTSFGESDPYAKCWAHKHVANNDPWGGQHNCWNGSYCFQQSLTALRWFGALKLEN